MESLSEKLNEIITAELNETGKMYTIGKFTGIGWRFNDKVTGEPKVSLKQYDKTVNLYFFPQEDGQPLLPLYEGVFKKSNMGKSCVRLKNLDDKKIAAIRQLLQKI